MGSRAGLRLYIGPDGIVERIQIRAVRGLFERGDEAKELRFAKELGESYPCALINLSCSKKDFSKKAWN